MTTTGIIDANAQTIQTAGLINGGSLSISGNTSIGGTLSVHGITRLQTTQTEALTTTSISASGVVTIGNGDDKTTLHDGVLTTSSNLSVNGITYLGTTNTGELTINGSATANKIITPSIVITPQLESTLNILPKQKGQLFFDDTNQKFKGVIDTSSGLSLGEISGGGGKTSVKISSDGTNETGMFIEEGKQPIRFYTDVNPNHANAPIDDVNYKQPDMEITDSFIKMNKTVEFDTIKFTKPNAMSYEQYVNSWLHFKSEKNSSTNDSNLVLDVISSFTNSALKLNNMNFSVSGNATISGTLTYSSDDRLKINERFITNALQNLLKLRPQLYDKLKRLNGNIEDTSFEAGLIAQEIWYDCPELRHLVCPGNDAKPDEYVASTDPSVDPDYSSWGSNPATVNYIGLIPYLISALQEQYNINEMYRIEMLEIKKEINILKNKTIECMCSNDGL